LSGRGSWSWNAGNSLPRGLYATVYSPDKSKGDPSEFDEEAWKFWARKFELAALDPAVHIVRGGKKDNFWMMGDTGPCGPCSELHVDLTGMGDTRGALVNAGDPRCIEIWNLVFIQFNANADGSFTPLPARHVDTGMGFERVTSIIQGTKNFADFAEARISNYETDVFRPIFDTIEELSGKTYGSTLPRAGSAAESEQEKIDVAFRVIADHIRTLSFAVADGIEPGNTDRHYVLRRILRRAVATGARSDFTSVFLSACGSRRSHHGRSVPGDSDKAGPYRKGDSGGGRGVQQDARSRYCAIRSGSGAFGGARFQRVSAGESPDPARESRALPGFRESSHLSFTILTGSRST
jgi:alanyl-tRNA synthetase